VVHVFLITFADEGLCKEQHDTTTASQEKLHPAPVSLKMVYCPAKVITG
jgi:hypothetical protein